MPTGYTSIITEGATFEQYLWRCARAFGALIMVRDDDFNAKIPDDVDPVNEDSYYAVSSRRAESELAKLRAMSPSEQEVECARWNAERLADWEKEEARRVETVAVLDAMIAKVNAWTPPTEDHAGLKKFMLEQIDTGHRYEREPRDKPKTMAAEEWHCTMVQNATDAIARGVNYLADERRRSEERNKWVRELKQSVPYAQWSKP